MGYSEPQHYDYYLAINELKTKEVFVAPDGFGADTPGSRTLLELTLTLILTLALGPTLTLARFTHAPRATRRTDTALARRAARPLFTLPAITRRHHWHRPLFRRQGEQVGSTSKYVSKYF